MNEQQKKEIEKVVESVARKWIGDIREYRRITQDGIEARFHFIQAALLVLGVLVGFLLARALL